MTFLTHLEAQDIANSETCRSDLLHCAEELDDIARILSGTRHARVSHQLAEVSKGMRSAVNEAKEACSCEQKSSAQTGS